MNTHTLHDQNAIARLWTKRWDGNSLEELKTSIEAMYGPFPLLFLVPVDGKSDGVTPSVVMTGLMAMPGTADRPDIPFIGAAVVGYLPIQGHDGTVLKQMGNVKVSAWDSYVKPTEVERPEMVSGELPEPSQ